MYVLENPVLQRELLVNLRTLKAFVLLFAYISLASAVVYFFWPEGETVDFLDVSKARRLFDTFFLGQFVMISLLTPAFAAGSMSGEKERGTYELLLASPLRPGAILIGKLLSSLCYISVVIFSSLPIVMICLPLGGVNFYEVLAAFTLLILSAGTFGWLCLACSLYFSRTTAAVVVSYLLILPLAILGVFLWQAMGNDASFRLFAALQFAPVVAGVVWVAAYYTLRKRLMYPPDLGSEGKEVVSEEEELKTAVGMVIQRDQFPDNLFAPSRRTTLLADNANPVFDKEMRSEIFSGGTLMARLVIQVSMFVAIPLMAFFLFFQPHLAAYYVGYVLLFNVLVAPVFMAGSVTSERERETLDLLLTTNLTPAEILWPKWLAGLRVATVLTLFLTPPLVLAGVMIPEFYPNWLSLLIYLAVILLTCLTTATLALLCSIVCRRTSVSLVSSYAVLIILFAAPVAYWFFAETLVDSGGASRLTWLTPAVAQRWAFTSPFAAAYSVPLAIGEPKTSLPSPVYLYFLAFYGALNLILMPVMLLLFKARWRSAQ